METAERLQRQIGTLNELHGIVRTMKALSAVSIRQYESAAESLQQYSRNVDLGLHALLRDTGQDILPAQYSQPAKQKQQFAAIIFGADHGMCGSFNDDISRFALQHIQEKYRVLTVGARIASILRQSDIRIEKELSAPSSAEGINNSVHELLVKIDEWRTETSNLHLRIFYNKRQNTGIRSGEAVDHDRNGAESSQAYRPFSFNLLPVDLNRFRHLEPSPWPSRHLPTYSMQTKPLMSALLRQYFFVSLFRASAESQASEHASRLNTMQAAEKNLQERLEQVKTLFRRVRQEAITTELLDLVSGFETIMEE